MKDKLKHAVLYGAAAGLFALKAAGCGDVYITNTFDEDSGSQHADTSLDLGARVDQTYQDASRPDSYLSPDAGIKLDTQTIDTQTIDGVVSKDALVPDTGYKTDAGADSQTTDSFSADAGSDALKTDSYALDQGAQADSLLPDTGYQTDSLAADTGLSDSTPATCQNLSQLLSCLGNNYTTLVSAGSEVTKAMGLGYQNVTMDEGKFAVGVVSGNPCTLPKQFNQTCQDYLKNNVAGTSLVELTGGNVQVQGGLLERIAALEQLSTGKLTGTSCTYNLNTATKVCK
ncbi:MAG: hypothetical protein ABIA37_02265 [Candidatus Woesearchaeota archaeon]